MQLWSLAYIERYIYYLVLGTGVDCRKHQELVLLWSLDANHTLALKELSEQKIFSLTNE